MTARGIAQRLTTGLVLVGCLITTAAAAAVPPPGHEERLAVAVPVRTAIGAALAAGDRGEPLPRPLVNESGLANDFWMHWWTCTIGWDSDRGRICPVGDLQAARTVVAYGDSHVGVWLPALHRMGRQLGFRVVPLVKLGCAPFDVVQLHAGAPYPSCPRFRDWSVSRIDRINPFAVVLGYRALWAVRADPGQTRAESWADGTRSAVRRLLQLTRRVVVLGDLSGKDFRPADCLARPDVDMGTCTTRVVDKVTRGNAVTRRAAVATGGEYVTTQNLVCRDGRCPLVVERIVTYHDLSHLTLTWTRRVSAELQRRIWP